MKKRITSILLAVLMLFSLLPVTAFATAQLYSFDFETDLLTEGWTQIDADGDGETWITGTNYAWDADPGLGVEGSHCALSQSYVNYKGALDADNWLFSPAITIPAGGATVSWYEGSQDPSWLDSYTVYVSETNTSTDTSKMTVLCDEHKAPGAANNNWSAPPISKELSAEEYGGKTVYIAFRHHDSDQFYLKIDNFAVEALPDPHTHDMGTTDDRTDDVTFATEIKTFNDLTTLFENGGSGYLANDITATAALTVSEDVSLCLNGKVLNLDGKGNITVSSGKAFNLYDCGTTEHAGYVDADGLWHLGTPANGETVKTITGGVITGGNAQNGGAVAVSGDFIMSGGSIVGNTASSSGGGVYVNGGTVILGGTAKITGNTAGSETKTANNLYLPESKTVTLGTGADGNGVAAPATGFAVGVTMQTPGKFTTNGTADDAKWFTSDNADYEVKYNTSGYLELVEAEEPYLWNIWDIWDIFDDDDKPVVRMSFRDVQRGAYYYDAVKWAVENGITTGKTSTEFDPTGAVTRAQAVTFLWRAAGCPRVNYFMKFTDLKPGAYYTEAVRWAVATGVTKGTTDTSFSPDAPVTRGQIMTFLYRYSKQNVRVGSNPFTDVKAGAYYYDAVLWALANGITGGMTATTFAPAETCNRAQVVSFLYRYMGK